MRWKSSHSSVRIWMQLRRKQLEYGSGLMELLKQPLYHPLSLHEKVITLCAATHKVLLGVEKTKIKQFQYDMLADVRDRTSGNRSGNRREESPDRGTDRQDRRDSEGIQEEQVLIWQISERYRAESTVSKTR